LEPVTLDEEPIHVLIVEDEWLIRELVAESLSEQGFVVHTAGNAADALRVVASARLDALFTDIDLPDGMDGVGLARRARELMPHLSVIYASGAADAFDPEACVPGSVFVPKPYAPALIGRLLAHAAGKSPARYVSA